MGEFFTALTAGFSLATQVLGIVVKNSATNAQGVKDFISHVESGIGSFNVSNEMQNSFDAQKTRQDAEEAAAVKGEKKV